MSISNVSCAANVWTLICSSCRQGRLRITLTDPSKYYFAIVPAGDPAPSTDVLTGSIFPLTGMDFQFREEIDIYIYAFDYRGRIEYNDDAPFTDVFVQDQTTPPIEYFLTEELNNVVIAASAGAKTKTLTLDPGHGFVVGDFIEIYAETPVGDLTLKRFVQLRVLAVVVDVITVQPFIGFDLDPVNIKFSKRTSADMAVDGSISPKRFKISPPNGLRWDLTRTMITMVVTTNPDDSLYGNLPALTNGVFFGFENDLTQEYLVNIMSNAGYRASAYDVTYTTRSSGGGSFGVSVRKSFAGADKYGVAIRLEGETNDNFVAYVNDNFILIDEHAQKVMGHLVE